MYSVSNAYKAKLLSQSDLERRIRGTVGGVAFTERDVLSGSLKISRKCVKGADVKLGGVFITTLKMSFLNSFVSRIQRSTWRGLEITGTIDLKLDDNGNWESVPFGHYFIDDATYGVAALDITAYDNMSKFEQKMALNTSSGKIYDFLNLACSNCGVSLGMTQAQVEALPNGTEALGIYGFNDMSTWRDLVSWTAWTAGGFADIDRNGRLVIRNFKQTVDMSISENYRVAGGVSDFHTWFTGLSVVNIADETTTYYAEATDDGLTMNMGSNPLLQFGTAEVKTRQRRAVLTALQNFDYTPFNMSFGFDICFDLGDVIQLTGGIAGTTVTCCVMSIDYVYFGFTKMQGYGNNPALYGAQGKTDKNLSGLSSKVDKNKITTLTFSNATSINVDSTWRTLAVIRATVLEEQNIQIHGAVKVNLADAGTVYVRFKVNEVLQPSDSNPFIHEVQAPRDNNAFTYFLPVPMQENVITEIIAEIKSTASGTVEIEDSWMSVIAVGLYELEWDGNLTARDDYHVELDGGLENSYSESITLDHQVGVSTLGQLADNYHVESDGDIDLDYSDATVPVLVLEHPIYDIVSADGDYQLVSADGDYYIQSA